MRVTPALPLLLAACSPPPTTGRPGMRVEAHRAAAGYYPQNSRTGVLASLEDRWDGIEIDLALTADGVPVLSHDPWVHPTLCERVDGGPMPERARLDGLTRAEVREGFLCGGIPDPAFPNAALHPEPIMTLDEVLDALHDADREIVVHLDLKVEPGWTPPADVMADAVLSRWVDADPAQPLVISANTPDAVLAVEAWGRSHGRDVHTWLGWPRFPVDGDPTSIGLGQEITGALGVSDPLADAERASADGLAMYWELARRPDVVRARRAGLEVALWTLDDPKVLRHHARWPVTALITDYPGDLP